MRFSLDSLQRAAAERLESRALAARLQHALAAVRARRGVAQADQDAGTIEAGEIGETLIEALIPADGARIAALPLALVRLSVDGADVSLSPADAEAHPLLTWLPDRVDGAVALPVLDAATLAGLAPGRPGGGAVGIVQRGEQEPRAAVVWEIDAAGRHVRLTAWYGSLLQDPPLSTIHNIDGVALRDIGLCLATGSQETASKASPLVLGEDTPPPAGAVIH